MQLRSLPWRGGRYVVTAQCKETAWACGRLASQEHGELFWLEVVVPVGPGSWKSSPGKGHVAATALKKMLTISEKPGEVG